MKNDAILPIGRQYFSDIRRDKAIYIDKTRYIYELCKPTTANYFLSRPRRFGKSLTLDTIAELFAGNQTLFEGLWVADKWDWTENYPIIRLSLDAIGYEGGLDEALKEAMHDIAEKFDIILKKRLAGSLFKELIEKIVQKTGKRVVILIDEYDKPIVDYIDIYNLEKANQQKEILKHFFSILKNASNHIRFLLITGVSKFAKLSIFSELNHLDDLTIDANYAALCGYTQTEITHYFDSFLQQMPPDTIEKMKLWYDGYSWDGKTFVYNPFSVLKFLKHGTYGNFWFETGTPTFLVKLLSSRFIYSLSAIEVSNFILDAFTLDSLAYLDINSLLLQTGYLTIKTKTDYGTFILDYPNQEVRQAFGQFLLGEFTQTSATL